MSHDINRDPEMWEFRALVGQRADAIWEEILSIADRNEGELPGTLQSCPRLLAGACHSTPTRLRLALEWLTTPRGKRLLPWVTVGFEQTLTVTNYLKYNPPRDEQKIPAGKQTSPLLSETSETSYPNLPKKKDNTSHPTNEWPSARALINLYNEKAPDECPAMEQISPARIGKARKYVTMFPKKEFWEEVFAEIHQSKFLRGLVKSDGHEGFKCNLDWLLTKGKDGTENCVKVAEGRYSR